MTDRPRGDFYDDMDLTVARYYYVFDSREHRTRVVDRKTGDEVRWHALPRIQLIEYVAETHSGSVLRQFARACARDTGANEGTSDSPTGRLWAAAQGISAQSRAQIRQAVTGAVVRAVTLGLSAGRSDAARLLTVHACTHPDPVTGAVEAAHMNERWAEFAAENDPRAAVRSVRQAHVDWLLDIVGSKHGAPQTGTETDRRS